MSYPLEPPLDEMATMARAAVDILTEFVGGLPAAPAADLDRDDRDDLVTTALRPPPEEPGSLGPLLGSFRDAARLAVETAGPAYMAYVPGGGLVTAALAELLAQTVNRYTGLASFAPALVAEEESVLGWMGREFGLPAATAAGVVTTGGSLATLTALVAARHDRLGDRVTGGTLYVTAHTHRCVAKAARIAGLAADQVRVVPTTADLRMDPEAAARMIATDRRSGKRPFLLVGPRAPPAPARSTRWMRWPSWPAGRTCGSTSTGPTGGSSSSPSGAGPGWPASSRPTRSCSIPTRACSCPTAPA